MTTILDIPDFCLVVLIGATGSGKSTFASNWFLQTEIVSSDHYRALVADDETDQSATADAFDLVEAAAGKRLKNRRLAVIDATNVRAADRRRWVDLARRYHALPVAIVVDPGLDVCIERNRTRPNRNFGPAVPQRMIQEIRRGLGGLQREGFRQVWKLSSVAEADGATIERRPLWTDQRQDRGPFDIIGDVHGCADELRTLLAQLGYVIDGPPDAPEVTAPHGRKLVFAGDLVDRGPDTPGVLRIAMAVLRSGIGYAVQGNHDQKLSRWLNGRDVKVAHGLQDSIDQLGRETPEFRDEAKRFLDDLRSHYWLDGGALAVAHAGLREDLIGRGSGAVRDFALYGETTGEIDAFGLPVRLNWAAEYRGKTSVVYGHTPVPEAEWVNNTVDIDTGCVFGGKLTALRWPERDLVAVPAARVYSEPVRPFAPSAEQLSGQAEADKLLDYEDVGGRRFVDTELMRRVVVPEENAAAALEVMSRFAIAPQWLVYLPPTMSPVETSTAPGYLERPEEAFGFFRKRGQTTVVLEEKHMGSRAVIALCRNDDVARRRFGVVGDEAGQVWTRTGRAFFDATTRDAVLTRLRQAADDAKLWDELNSDWVLLDAEIMPWSFKASGLIANQYEPVATASRDGLTHATAALDAAKSRGVDVAGLDTRFAERLDRAARYARVWAPYAWPVSGIDELHIAPFHLLASEGATHFDRDHRWHMAMANRLVDAGPGIVTRTRTFEVTLSDESSCAAGAAWWETIVTTGGEGMVVKPLDFIARGSKGLIQPALKVRGPEYLRIIYGPEYDLPENLERLRKRGLGGKRALALKEFALGHEALRRFSSGAPLRQVHECAFALLALESEPVDPRL
jgi:protein phosphatase